MKKVGYIVVMLVLIVGMSAFAAGDREAAAAEGEFRVAVAMSPMNNPFHRTLYRFFEEEIERAPANFRFRFYFSDSTDVQVNNMEVILAGNYDGVIISTHDGNVMAGPAERIRRAGAKTVVVNRGLNTDEWDAYVTGDNVGGGENIARYMGEYLNGEGNVYVLGLAVGTPLFNDRMSGFERVMREEFPNIRILGVSEGTNTIEGGFNAMENVLQAHPTIHAVYSHDPFGAMGQEQAINNAGRTDVRLIMSFAPDQSVVDHMRANPDTIFRGNVAYPPAMSAEAVRVMVRLLQGEEVPRETIMSAELMLIEDLDEWADTVPSVTGR
ncbi:MAG: sugar ABC transporter substrate-binding protein [Spirochaetaceae bacterium]|nr:MAG: sugar ABC transporter substrate-binding protein [Spirochaetaceae bacterium]